MLLNAKMIEGYSLRTPEGLDLPNHENQTIPAALTKEQVESSPRAEATKTPTAEYEAALRTHYAWTGYWSAFAAPVVDPVLSGNSVKETTSGATGDPGTANPLTHRLQRVHEVHSWSIQATDGEIGHVEDVIIAPERDWEISQILIDTRNWLPGRKVLVAPLWVSEFNSERKQVEIKLDRETIKGAPRFDPDKRLDPAYESELKAHYQSSPAPR